jgi:GntR family transcriptional regulator, transcriptional repressor for pyruvate dehydrogenase complex
VENLFSALQREDSLVKRVSEQLEELIVSGKLTPGQALPPETRLARLLGVSRTVVREALSSLLARQLLEAQGGSLLVSSPTAESIGRSMSLMLLLGRGEPDHNKVLEVRRLLEVEIAGLAALRRTDRDLALLARNLDEFAAAHQDAGRLPGLDIEFHRALAQATQNELFLVLIDALADTLMLYRRVAIQTPGMPGRALHHHRAVCEQVSAGSPEGARTAMLNHMLEAEETVHEALSHASDSQAQERIE